MQVKDMQSLAQKAQQAASNNPRGGAPNGSDYMNFSGKRGILQIGQDKRQVNSDELWVVDVTSFEEGWVCWKGGQPAANRLSNIYTGVPVPQPDFNEFGPFDTNRGDGWFQAKAMVMKSLDNDQQGYFKINSVSGVSEMADLFGKFSQKAAAGLPAWPVVSVSSEPFTSNGFQNYKPIFNVQAWLSDEQLQSLATGDVDLDEILDGGGEAPAIEEEKTDTAPKGRRRSRG